MGSRELLKARRPVERESMEAGTPRQRAKSVVFAKKSPKTSREPPFGRGNLARTNEFCKKGQIVSAKTGTFCLFRAVSRISNTRRISRMVLWPVFGPLAALVWPE